jgi:hypothetical protein
MRRKNGNSAMRKSQDVAIFALKIKINAEV